MEVEAVVEPALCQADEIAGRSRHAVEIKLCGEGSQRCIEGGRRVRGHGRRRRGHGEAAAKERAATHARRASTTDDCDRDPKKASKLRDVTVLQRRQSSRARARVTSCQPHASRTMNSRACGRMRLPLMRAAHVAAADIGDSPTSGSDWWLPCATRCKAATAARVDLCA